MNDYSGNEIAQEDANNFLISDEFSELRSLLLGVEPTKLNELYQRLENTDIQAGDISRLLPEAIVLRTMQDKELGEAIVPTIEQAIQSSVKQDLNILSTAIFPIVGPAIRKAVSTVLDEMVQSLNQALEHSLSVQSFKWRLEARQTGKAFAEVVLLRSLVYQVEQVFLIHKETGLLLQHIVTGQTTLQDPALISAMLTAIQDFVKDSFGAPKDDNIQSLQFGELTIWIEQGPKAVIAGIIRGNAPQELRAVFQQAIEKIHLRLGRELNDFQGETTPFVLSKPYLESCLEARYNIPEKTKYAYVWGLVAAFAIAFGFWGFLGIREQLRWNAYLEQLNSQPGIVVLKTRKDNNKYLIYGMRDPLAADPNILLRKAKINPKMVVGHWQPYLSLEPQFTSQRAGELLQTPKTVSLTINQKGVLIATGSAPNQWISSARKLWRFIPGVTQYQDDNLNTREISQLQLYKNQIEQETLLFIQGTTNYLPGEEKKLKNLAVIIQKLLDKSKDLGRNVQIQILGHTDTEGTEQTNIQLSQDRANKILSDLRSQGIDTKIFHILGVASTQPLQLGSRESQQVNRRVSFKVSFNRS